MLRGRGVLDFWFLGAKVSKLLGFKVSWFLGFFVSKFLGFEVPKIYQISISCSLQDIDPIPNTFKILLDGSAGFFGALFPAFLFPKFCDL